MVVGGIGIIFVYVGKLFIAVLSTVIAYGMIKKIDSLNSNIDSVLLPVVVFAILSFAQLFLLLLARFT